VSEETPDISDSWEILAWRTVYDSDWVRVHQIDVKLPHGQAAPDWHLLDYPREAVGIVPIGPDGRILMIDPYRFTTETIATKSLKG